MSNDPSLIQLSAYDPAAALPEDSPLAKLGGVRKPRQKTAGSSKRAELMAKFEASEDPKERKRLLDRLLKDEVG